MAPRVLTAVRRGLLAALAVLLWVLGTLGALLVAGGASVYWWAGRDGSLAQTLTWVAPWVADGQRLTWQDAQGNLLNGGHVALLRWQQDGLTIEVRDLHWRLPADGWTRLWRDRHLSLDELAAGEVVIADESAPSPREGSPLPADRQLPWLRSVDVPLVVDRLLWQTLTATDLRLHYVYGPLASALPPATPDIPHHRVVLEHAVLRADTPQGTLTAPLRGSAAVTASGMALLQAQINATLEATPTDAPVQRWQAALRVHGSLADKGGLTAGLDLQAANGPASATATAELSPWADWPLHSATVRLASLDLSTLWPHWPRTRLEGSLNWQPNPDAGPAADHWTVQGQLINGSPAPWNRRGLPLRAAQVDLRVHGQAADLKSLALEIGEGTVQAAGKVRWSPDRSADLLDRLQALQGLLTVRDVVPDNLWAGTDTAPLSITLQGHPLPGMPITDAVKVTLNARQGPARITAQGHWLPRAGVQGGAQLNLPGLSAVFDGFAGLPSRVPRGAPALPAQSHLSLRVTRLAEAQSWLRTTAERWAPLLPSLPATVAAWTEPARDGELDLKLRWGREPEATLTAQAELTVEQRRWRLTLAPTTVRWNTNDPLHGTWTVGASYVLATVGRRATAPQAHATLRWTQAEWRNGIVQVQGQLDPVQVLPWLRAWSGAAADDTAPPFTPETALQAQWVLSWPIAMSPSARDAPAPRVTVRLDRTAGDLLLPAPDGTTGSRVAGGVRAAQIDLDWDGRRLLAQTMWDSERAGRINASVQATLPASLPTDLPWPVPPDTTLAGTLHAAWPSLAVLGPWLPPGWRVDGRLQAEVRLGGKWAVPTLDGTLRGSALRLVSLADGIDWRDGLLQARLTERTLDIEQLQLSGTGGGDAGGTLRGSGRVRWTPGDDPTATMTLQAQRWRVLARADRRLTLSGDMTLQAAARRLTVGGQLRVDQARWRLQDADTPRLGEDVVIRGAPPPPAPTRPWPPGWTGGVDVALALGPDFRLEGRGLDTRLTGSLRWQQTDINPPHLSGEVSTRQGRYRAYGQTLDIARGTLRFGGVVDDPALDLLAVRSQPQQTVGVEVTGSARTPRVRLVAEPSLPDSEILARLVLGRSATGVGAESALLQRAALALLSGPNGGGANLPAIVGLDELAYEAEGTNPDGTPRAGAVSLGKRLSNRLYLGYRRSLVGLVGTVSILYDVSRRLTLRAQAGDDNAIELLYTRRYD
ncbi:Translocation and assembly module TamB [Tepidimonas thermarum]|uniref:Translocation and assembly module TamB n=1 Tax=Tepidimonas thermarum TaxID=335431 RepID=A0A554X0H2_9BURK|nr:translocation/assembly module TamB domain-containing protein [Tepidimonas thermarum]TSE29357.1 Translocation and assembly module TamB [Tepidimonas thermarum]